MLSDVSIRQLMIWKDFNPPSRSVSADEKEVVNSPMLASGFWVQGKPWGLIPFIYSSICCQVEISLRQTGT
jgi:hypothetical protein